MFSVSSRRSDRQYPSRAVGIRRRSAGGYDQPSADTASQDHRSGDRPDRRGRRRGGTDARRGATVRCRVGHRLSLLQLEGAPPGRGPGGLAEAVDPTHSGRARPIGSRPLTRSSGLLAACAARISSQPGNDRPDVPDGDVHRSRRQGDDRPDESHERGDVQPPPRRRCTGGYSEHHASASTPR